MSEVPRVQIHNAEIQPDPQREEDDQRIASGTQRRLRDRQRLLLCIIVVISTRHQLCVITTATGFSKQIMDLYIEKTEQRRRRNTTYKEFQWDLHREATLQADHDS